MNIKKFDDLIAWQKAKQLTVAIYKNFGSLHDYSFKDQICRAVISITNNIAEGFERHTNKEFINFLYIAKGSCGEVKSMLEIAKELKYLDNTSYNIIAESATEVSKIIGGLIKSLHNK